MIRELSLLHQFITIDSQELMYVCEIYTLSLTYRTYINSCESIVISAGLIEGLLGSIAHGGKYVKGSKAVNILIFILFFIFWYIKFQIWLKISIKIFTLILGANLYLKAVLFFLNNVYFYKKKLFNSKFTSSLAT